MTYRLQKDAILDKLAEAGNVAQFVAFDPGLRETYSRVRGCPANHRFGSIEGAITSLFSASAERALNIRSFDPTQPRSSEFLYGLREPPLVMNEVKRLAGSNLHTIVNETIDVNDGGVSGVFLGNLVEFAPGDTPRCVEKPGTLAMPRAMAAELFRIVYGFTVDSREGPGVRIEFSIHPNRRGWREQHIILWELERGVADAGAAEVRWPNRFSRLIGDKAFGLLIAHLCELPVPRTTVISRAVAPFVFGEETGLHENWIRTCPTEQIPGHYSTFHGWRDPYLLLSREDPSGKAVASVISQRGINASFSGALITGADGSLIVEGVEGVGDSFMQGTSGPQKIPDSVAQSVRTVARKAMDRLGPVRFEWVHDRDKTWVVQFHRGATESSGMTIVPGEPRTFRRFEVEKGLAALRELVGHLRPDEGIALIGDVGMTSHFGDVLRRAKVPSRLERGSR
jgi:hypothetical protein